MFFHLHFSCSFYWLITPVLLDLVASLAYLTYSAWSCYFLLTTPSLCPLTSFPSSSSFLYVDMLLIFLPHPWFFPQFLKNLPIPKTVPVATSRRFLYLYFQNILLSISPCFIPFPTYL